MSDAFPFVNIPPELRKVIGEASPPGTRVFRREGTSEECRQWFDAIAENFEGAGVSPGGVSMFVPVSRAAVHNRLKKGLLTAFTFYITEDEKSFFGTTRKRKQRPYMLIPTAECKAWAQELKLRAGTESHEPASEAEVEEGWQFVLKDPKDKGNKKVVYKEPPMTRDEIMFEIQCGVRFGLEKILADLLPGKLGAKHRKRVQGGGLTYDCRTKKWCWKE